MAQITITLDATQSQRVATAFGRAYHLTDPLSSPENAPRDATAAEVKQFLINYMRGVVQDTEAAAARASLASPADLTAT